MLVWLISTVRNVDRQFYAHTVYTLAVLPMFSQCSYVMAACCCQWVCVERALGVARGSARLAVSGDESSMPPPVDEPAAVPQSRDAPAPQPVDELIDALDAQHLECMDDRMSQSSGDAGFEIVDGDGFVIVDGDAKGAGLVRLAPLSA